MASGVPGLMNPYVRVEDTLCKVPLSWKAVRDFPGPLGAEISSEFCVLEAWGSQVGPARRLCTGVPHSSGGASQTAEEELLPLWLPFWAMFCCRCSRGKSTR